MLHVRVRWSTLSRSTISLRWSKSWWWLIVLLVWTFSYFIISMAANYIFYLLYFWFYKKSSLPFLLKLYRFFQCSKTQLQFIFPFSTQPELSCFSHFQGQYVVEFSNLKLHSTSILSCFERIALKILLSDFSTPAATFFLQVTCNHRFHYVMES